MHKRTSPFKISKIGKQFTNLWRKQFGNIPLPPGRRLRGRSALRQPPRQRPAARGAREGPRGLSAAVSIGKFAIFLAGSFSALSKRNFARQYALLQPSENFNRLTPHGDEQCPSTSNYHVIQCVDGTRLLTVYVIILRSKYESTT